MFRQTCVGLLREEIVVGQNESSWFYLYLLYCKYLQIHTSETLSLTEETYHACLSHSNLSSVVNLEFPLDLICKAGWVITKVKQAYLSICSMQCFAVYTIVISNTGFSVAVFTFCTSVRRCAVRRFVVSSSYLRRKSVWRKISIIT
jgi:hypothetical protein